MFNPRPTNPGPGLGFRVWDVRFLALGFRIRVFGVRVLGLGCKVFGFRVYGSQNFATHMPPDRPWPFHGQRPVEAQLTTAARMLTPSQPLTSGFRTRIQSLGLRVQGLRFRIQGFRFKVQSLGFHGRVLGLGIGGLGFRV